MRVGFVRVLGVLAVFDVLGVFFVMNVMYVLGIRNAKWVGYFVCFRSVLCGRKSKRALVIFCLG